MCLQFGRGRSFGSHLCTAATKIAQGSKWKH